jgi:hypothetical protein
VSTGTKRNYLSCAKTVALRVVKEKPPLDILRMINHREQRLALLFRSKWIPLWAALIGAFGKVAAALIEHLHL